MSNTTTKHSKLLDINPQLLKIYIIISCIMLLLALGFAYALVRLAMSLDVAALAWWASLATLALPLAGILGFYVGSQVSKLVMRGVDLGVGKVSESASEAINLRGQATAMARMGATPPPDMAAIQDLLISPGGFDAPAQVTSGRFGRALDAAELEKVVEI